MIKIPRYRLKLIFIEEESLIDKNNLVEENLPLNYSQVISFARGVFVVLIPTYDHLWRVHVVNLLVILKSTY